MRLTLAPAVALCVLALACARPEDDAKQAAPAPAPAPAPQTSPAGSPGDPTVPANRGIPAQKLEDLPEGDSYLTNLPQLVDQLGLSAYYRQGQHGQGLTIAVLDNGFSGLNLSIGKRLPPTARLLSSPRPDMEDTTHGVKLAEIAYALATGSNSYRADVQGPNIVLANTDGFTNFQGAVAAAIEAKADIVLYAQVWEYGGNFNGQGFINAEVEKATKAGILWVNAAGNFGQAVYNGAVTTAGKDVKLPYQGKYVRFSVPRDGMPIKAVLAWNDFEDSKDYKTAQDLDLILEDVNHQEIGESRLHQTGAGGNTSDPNFSAHAREIINGVLNAGLYYLRVEAISNNFDAQSRLRLSVDGDGIRFIDQANGNGGGDDSLMIPADNPTVLAVGASDVDYSGRMSAPSGGRAKPEVQVASLVAFSDGESHQGTSAASAIVAGTLAVLEGAYGKVGRDGILALVDQGKLTVATPLAGKPATLRLPDPSKL